MENKEKKGVSRGINCEGEHDRIVLVSDQRSARSHTTRVSALEAKLNVRLKSREDNFETRFMDVMNMMNVNMHERMDAIEAGIPTNMIEIREMADHLKTVEETVFVNGKKLLLTRESVQLIAAAISVLNNTAPNLDNTLPEVLHGSVYLSISISNPSLIKSDD
jgi:hypothetical protein